MKSQLLVVSLFLLPLLIVAQTVPPLINYQGRLSNPDGSPLATGNYELTFKVYDAASGGNTIWGPQLFDGNVGVGHGAMVPVVQGYFNVVLGPADIAGATLAGAFTTSNRFVEVTVTNHPPIAPRQQILSAPYALQAGNSTTLANSDWSAVFGTNDPINGKIPGYKLTNGLTLNVSNLTLPSPVVSILSGSSLLLRADGSENFFAGQAAGNTIVSGSNNTGLGYNALTLVNVGSNNTAVGSTAMDAVRNGHDNTGVGYQALTSISSATENTAVGSGALAVSTASFNTAVGYQALAADGNGSRNTAVGTLALQSNTIATENVAIGFGAMTGSTQGNNNTAVGFNALNANSVGVDNVAVGWSALAANVNGNQNTAVGRSALGANNTAIQNTALGWEALATVTAGDFNTAAGYESMQLATGQENAAFGYQTLQNTAAFGNTAMGFQAGVFDTTGSNNAAFGSLSTYFNVSGYNNTGIGAQSLFNNTNGNNNTAVGYQALYNAANGSANIAIGSGAGFNVIAGVQNIEIGSPGNPADSGVIRLGQTQTATYISGIFGATIAGGLQVYATASGQLGIFTSSARFKENISSMKDASDVLLSLHPVTFNYRPELDPHHIPQFGLVAEEVAKVDPDLVVRDDKNQVYSVRYDAVNAMLLNEFLKEHRTVQEEKDKISDLEQRLDALEKLVLSQKSK